MNTALIRPQWGPATVALMVLGFVVWWPLGLAMLAYILWGEMFGGSAEKAQRFMSRSRHFAEGCAKRGPWANAERSRGFGGFGPTSGNAAFDDYRAEQLRRLEEERKRLDEEIEAFQAYMRNLRMARDREEFDRFMRDRNNGRNDVGPGNLA